MPFTLDSAGTVAIEATFEDFASGLGDEVAFTDLTPFAQGYIEALFASYRPDFYRIKAGVKPYGGKRLKVAFRAFDPDGGALREVTGYVHVSASKVATSQRLYRADELEMPAFSDLAPETLARIIADCAEMGRLAWGADAKTAEAGQRVWGYRQAGMLIFPPLTVQLGDDGKLRFAA